MVSFMSEHLRKAALDYHALPTPIGAEDTGGSVHDRLAVLGAEYVLRWLPPGTHDWRRFLRPSELVRELEANGLSVSEIAGVTYNPLNDRWRRSRDLDVNYMLFAARTA